MRSRAFRLWRRLRGKALAYAVYAAAMAVAGYGLWILAEREYHARLERLHHQLDDVTGTIATLVGSGLDHVELMAHQAEALLADPSTPEAARRLFQGLAPSDSFAGYALDRIPAGQNVERLSNLTGAGEIPPIESGAGKEMLMALSLNPLFAATRDQVPDAAWIYYASGNHFIATHPWVSSRLFHWSENLLTYEFYRNGMPERNPIRAAFWTDLYVDAAGKGLMATVAKPVYDKNGQFRGTINLDLTLRTMWRFLSRGDFGQARALLVNAQHHVIADTAWPADTAPQSLIGLADVLPDDLPLNQVLPALGDEPRANLYHAGWLLHSFAVEGAPWRVVMLLEQRNLILEVLQSVWIGFVGLALLAVALVAVEQRRRTGSALAENVTALQRMTLTLAAARDEAQQANSAKSMLLANVSHELRTPLNAIIGFSDLMRHHLYGPLGNPRYDEYLDDIRNSGTLLLSLINDLLDVTKLEAGRTELAETDCDLAALVSEAVGLVKLQAERGGVALQVRADDDLPVVYADERALRQVVLNLLSNAVKFTPSGGSVTISCSLQPSGSPAIVVKDTGHGIPHEEMQDLFQPFARTASAKRASTPGTGLGLVIVKSLVELHQGSIKLESRVGFGTTVTVVLPAARVLSDVRRGAA